MMEYCPDARLEPPEPPPLPPEPDGWEDDAYQIFADQRYEDEFICEDS